VDMARDIRRRALEQIATLSATGSSVSFDKSDLDRLCKAVPNHGKLRDTSNGYDQSQKHGVGRHPMVRPGLPTPANHANK
jgi:phosphatidylinositol 4-kinase A